VCDVCRKIFKLGFSPVTLGRADITRTGQLSAHYLPFASNSFPHHLTFESLRASAKDGCNICLSLLHELSRHEKGREERALENGGPYIDYYFELDLNIATKNPHKMEIRFPGIAEMIALPAKGKSNVCAEEGVRTAAETNRIGLFLRVQVSFAQYWGMVYGVF
jgi:hypothetical protein